MEPTYNEQEIAEHYIGVIKQKRAQGFTDEQIAKDIGFPLETVQRVNTDDTLPENPNEKEDKELPMEGTGNGQNSSGMDAESENSESGDTEEKELDSDIPSNESVQEMEDMGSIDNNQNEKLDVKEEYTLEQSAEDMFSDDTFKQLKAEFAQTKIRHSKLFNHIGKVMIGEEEDVMPVEMLQIKADVMQAYLTVLGVQMNMVKRMEKEIKKDEEDK